MPYSLPPNDLSAFFFSNATATTEIYTLSLHDALPISLAAHASYAQSQNQVPGKLSALCSCCNARVCPRSEEHTSELQSPYDLVCRLLLEKKNQAIKRITVYNAFHMPFLLVLVAR